LNPTHGTVVANSDEIERQVLTQRNSYVYAICHQVGNHLPESLITFVFCVVSHNQPPHAVRNIWLLMMIAFTTFSRLI
jgi:hypothetical protein